MNPSNDMKNIVAKHLRDAGVKRSEEKIDALANLIVNDILKHFNLDEPKKKLGATVMTETAAITGFRPRSM